MQKSTRNVDAASTQVQSDTAAQIANSALHCTLVKLVLQMFGVHFIRGKAKINVSEGPPPLVS